MLRLIVCTAGLAVACLQVGQGREPQASNSSTITAWVAEVERSEPPVLLRSGGSFQSSPATQLDAKLQVVSGNEDLALVQTIAPVIPAPLPSPQAPGYQFEESPTPQDEVDAEDAEAVEPVTSRLSRTGTASVQDAYRLFVSLAIQHGRLRSATDAAQMSFAQLRGNLRRLCVISPKCAWQPDECLQRDMLALMATNYLNVRAGLLTGLFGATRRYAHREMVYQEVVAPGPPKTLVSGSELLSVVTRISRRARPNRSVGLDPDEIH